MTATLARAARLSRRAWPLAALGGVFIVALSTAACQPTVRLEAPDKPIVINLNIKIEQEVRIKVERDVDTLLKQNQELF
jgi:hypothetical protein